MCEQCKHLDQQLKEESAKLKLSPRNWWAGVIVTIIIFVITQVYVSGKIVGNIEQHVVDDPTYKQMVTEFARKEEVNPRIEKIERMVEYLYLKQGGRKIDE